MTSIKKMLQLDWSGGQLFAQQTTQFVRATIDSIQLNEQFSQPYVLVTFQQAYVTSLSYAQWRQVNLINLQIPLSQRSSTCEEVGDMIKLPTDNLDEYFLVPRTSMGWVDLSTLPR
jgi:hypothetical protein